MSQIVILPGGEVVPALGQGTWMMGEQIARRRDEIAALQCGLDLGLRLIDTAEMYGDGRAEEIVGEALRGRRDEAFVVSKVYPHNATRHGTVAACERSLARLGTDRIDLYLLHWRGNVPFAETIEAFERLRAAGKIRHWGVSNLDTAEMGAWWRERDGERCAVDQVLYNLGRRGIERDLLPWCRARGVALMAYSPVEQARLLDDPRLAGLARRVSLTPAQLALAWVLRQDGVVAIPKAGRREHVEENAAALAQPLDAATLAELDRLFPPPDRPVPLEMI